MLTSVSFGVFTKIQQEKLMDGIRVELKEPEFEFQWIFDKGKGNLARVSGEFELFEFELTE